MFDSSIKKDLEHVAPAMKGFHIAIRTDPSHAWWNPMVRVESRREEFESPAAMALWRAGNFRASTWSGWLTAPI